MANSTLGRRLVVSVLLCAVGLSGCTRMVTRYVAAYRPGESPTTQPVPESSVYKVIVYARNGSGKLHGIDGTERVLPKGRVVGFRTDENGVVYALVGNDEIPLSVTADRKVVWCTQYERQTQFGREIGKATRTAGNTALLVGFYAMDAAIRGSDDDSCDDD